MLALILPMFILGMVGFLVPHVYMLVPVYETD